MVHRGHPFANRPAEVTRQQEAEQQRQIPGQPFRPGAGEQRERAPAGPAPAPARADTSVGQPGGIGDNDDLELLVGLLGKTRQAGFQRLGAAAADRPEAWIFRAPSSTMRLAEAEVPGSSGLVEAQLAATVPYGSVEFAAGDRDQLLVLYDRDVADMDRDGDVDVILGQHNLADTAASELLIFENTGGGWQRHSIHKGDEHHDGSQVVDIDNDVSDSPRFRPARPVPDRLHDTTVAFVTAFEFRDLCARHPELVSRAVNLGGPLNDEFAFYEIPSPLVNAIYAPHRVRSPLPNPRCLRPDCPCPYMQAVHRPAEGAATGKIVDVVEVAAPERRCIRFLQGHDVRVTVLQHSDDGVQVAEGRRGVLQQLVKAVAATVGDVYRQDPEPAVVQPDRRGCSVRVRLHGRRDIAQHRCATGQQQGGQQQGLADKPVVQDTRRHCPCYRVATSNERSQSAVRRCLPLRSMTGPT